MRKTVYIETSIPSFYYGVRADPEAVDRRNWTREWWDRESAKYDLVTSEVVSEELGAGDYPHKSDAIALLDALPLLSVEDEIAEIATVYIARKVMPKAPVRDAVHLALASYYKCDFLLTWNCAHLANPNKFDHIRQVNMTLGLFTPALVTPLEMLGEEIGDEG